MRKFEYTVTIDLDDSQFSADSPLAKEMNAIYNLDGPDMVAAMAECKFPAAIRNVLSESMGDVGNTTVDVVFSQEVK